MKIYFSYPKKAYDNELRKFGDKIFRFLHSKNSAIIEDSVDLTPEEYPGSVNEPEFLEDFFTDVKRNILISSAVIVDATLDSFESGFKTTLALLYKKPVLCLSHKKDYSVYINDPNFIAAKYKTSKDLEIVLEKFHKKLRNQYLSVRYNGFLTPEQRDFLEWYGQTKGMNISEVIRDFINEKMDLDNGYIDSKSL